MIASLPMYDTAATKAANDRFWLAIRTAYGHGPAQLDRETGLHETWTSDRLVLSQTCGLPYRSLLHGKVQLVGTPHYDIEGCPPGYYRSAIVARADDPRSHCREFSKARLARNDAGSQSGWAALVAHFEDINGSTFAPKLVIDTGSHAASVAAVAAGQADFAAIDVVTWALLKRDSDAVHGLKILDHTAPTPGLPFITSLYEDASKLFSAVSHAISNLSASDRDTLMLKGIVHIPAGDYLSVPTP